MKEQRCGPKHRQVHPRRHHRSERGVTHPLPLFDSSSLLTSDKIMSPSETLNSDFRSFAHHILEVLVSLTSRLFDDFNSQVVEGGVVTVLVSLLANEEGSVQNYACAVLANLLSWETVAKARQSLSDVRRYRTALIDQLTTCGGHRQLALLLTSPSASVNLAVGKNYAHTHPTDYDSGGMGVGLGRASTSNIQGVCNKHASRALIGMFYPDAPVFSRSNNNKHDIHTTSEEDWLYRQRYSEHPSHTSSDTDRGSGEGVAPNKSIWKFSTPLPPISLCSTSSLAHLKSSPRHHLHTRSSSHSRHVTPQHTPSPLPQIYATQHSLSPLQLFLLTDDTARAWQFTYFYKSGAFKDQFPAFLRFFSHDCVRGKGVDAIGFFTLEGRVESDIIGQKLLLSKTYHRHLTPSDVTQSQKDEGSVPSDDPLSCIERDEREAGSQAHVRHLAYWSEGVVFSHTDYESAESEYWSHRAEKCSLGLWGVWETCTSQPHYELQKGGVFRVTPVDHID